MSNEVRIYFMNPQEGKENKERINRGDLVRLTVGLIGVAGIVTVGAMAPGLLQLIPQQYRRRYSVPQLRQTIRQLDAKGFLLMRKTSDGTRIFLSKRGRAELLSYELGQKQIPRPKKWDQKWRLLIFDIPESRKNVRNRIRSFLIGVGFVWLQDSVWVHPFECRDILELLRTKFGARHDALYVRAEAIDHDRLLRKKFKLEAET